MNTANRSCASLHAAQGMSDPEEMLSGLRTPEGVANPYPFYDRLRTVAPAYQSSAAGGLCFLSSWTDANTLLRSKMFGNGPNAPIISNHPSFPKSEGFRRFADFMIFKDPPEHTRLRSITANAFAPALSPVLKARIESHVNALIQDLQTMQDADLIEDFAAKLPIAVMADIIGIPAPDQPMVAAWIRTQALGLGPNMTDALIPSIDASTLSLQTYLRDLINQQTTSRDDKTIIARLKAETAQTDTPELAELIALLNVLLSAGVETTQNLLGTAVRNLLHAPDQRARLMESNAFDQTCSDEFIRLDGPAVVSNVRFAQERFHFSGLTIEPGTPVIAVLAAANRDPAIFENPGQMDIGRKPNPHLGFAAGIHACLGAGLARLEVSIAIPALMRRLPGLCTNGEATFSMGAGAFRTITAMPIRTR